MIVEIEMMFEPWHGRMGGDTANFMIFAWSGDVVHSVKSMRYKLLFVVGWLFGLVLRSSIICFGVLELELRGLVLFWAYMRLC